MFYFFIVKTYFSTKEVYLQLNLNLSAPESGVFELYINNLYFLLVFLWNFY